jgi:photosystem II stability/assembly factor-like uncharacterized protein
MMKKRIASISVCMLLFVPLLSAIGAMNLSEASQDFNGEWINPQHRLESGDILELDVTITLEPYNPPITIPASGGNFQYSITIDNNEATPMTFDVWTMVTLPNGNPYGPLFGPIDFHIPDGWSSNRDDLIQQVPDFAPPGDYTYIAYVGLYPDEIWNSDRFTFEKLPVGGWYSQSPGVFYELRGVDFVDVDNGWAVSDYQEIIHTTDGGDTWHHQDDGQNYPHQYNDVSFVDTQTGWVVGHGWSLGGTILHTTDAGEHWIEQESYYDYEFHSVFFLDASTGWAVGGYVDYLGSNHKRIVEHTSDGGNTWYGQHSQSYRYPLSSVHFVDANNGWAVGGPGYILHTTNGGNTWNEQTSGTNQYLQSVFFMDANTGWCVGEEGTVLHTTNGGDYWYPQATGTTNNFEGVCFVDANTGWIAGVDWSLFRPVIMQTTDGGNTWNTQDPGTGNDEVYLNDICFVDENHGWAAGALWPATGVMLHIEEGGE